MYVHYLCNGQCLCCSRVALKSNCNASRPQITCNRQLHLLLLPSTVTVQWNGPPTTIADPIIASKWEYKWDWWAMNLLFIYILLSARLKKWKIIIISTRDCTIARYAHCEQSLIYSTRSYLSQLMHFYLTNWYLQINRSQIDYRSHNERSHLFTDLINRQEVLFPRMYVATPIISIRFTYLWFTYILINKNVDPTITDIWSVYADRHVI